MPEKFDISYIAPDGAQHRPVMLHRTVYGSLERFLGILIEHFAGAFPYWLAPVQVRLVPVSEDHNEYVKTALARLKERDVRVDIDLRDEKLGKRIRDAQLQKIPFMIVAGDREIETQTVAVRDRAKGDLGSMSLEGFLEHLKSCFDPMR
jgi:threonyl-tRNA synthetase